jgi:hypothetical protein
MKLTFADLAVMAIYFLFVLGIGVAQSSEAELLEEREHETGLEHEAGEDDR